MFKATARLTETNPNGKTTFTIEQGETPSQIMERTGFGDIEVIGAVSNDVDPFTGLAIPSSAKNDKVTLYLKNVPWTDSGYESLQRKATWVSPIQNKQYGNILEPLSDSYQLHSFTMMGKRGEWIVWQFEVPDFYIDKDPNGGHSSLLTIAENRANGKKWFGNQITRLFCANQFSAQVNAMRKMVNGANADLMLDVSVFLENARIKHMHDLDNLFLKPVKKDDIIEFANAMFPMPEPRKNVAEYQQAKSNGYDMSTPKGLRMDTAIHNGNRDYEASMKRHDAHMKEFFNRVDSNTAELGANAYALWNAGTEHQTHSELFKSDTATKELNMLFGGNAKASQEAWTVLNK